MKIALIGLGYWGPNLLRNFHKHKAVAAAFDLDEDKLKKFAADPAYYGIYFNNDYQKAFGRRDVQAVAIATPPHTHYKIAKESLEAGKHVFVEKPMTTNVAEAEELVALAKKKGLLLMVGHTFLYTAEVRKIKEIVESEELGDIKYIHASRLNLGKFQKSNVVADLSPHDISIFNHIVDCPLTRVSARGYGFINKEIVEVSFLNFEYECGVVCHLHLSWLDPKKERVTTFVGTKKMLIYDMLAEEKIKVYDKGVDLDKNANAGYGEYLLSYRHGDIWAPATEVYEPLGLECEHFINCLKGKEIPFTDGENGLAVVKGMSAALESLSKDGDWIWVT